MKILLLGAYGQVGELQRSLSLLGQLLKHGKDTADFETPSALAALVLSEKPNIIVNAEVVATLANAAKKIDACLIHYSTDYVFDDTARTLQRGRFH